MSAPRLAILDWGVGGLGVARLFAAEVGFLYLSDSGATPYGRMDRAALAARLGEVARWLADQGAERLIIACNAASTSIPDVAWPIEATGTLEAAVAVCAPYRRVGLVGGRRTVQAGRIAAALRSRGVQVRARVAQPLSALVEAGRLEGDEVEAEVGRVVAPLRGAEALLLACTHYPALEPVFRRALPGMPLLDPAPGMVVPGAPGPRRFVTTGDPAASTRSAALAWGLEAAFEPLALG